MDNTQEAAGVVQAPQTEATPNTNIEQAPAVDMHGFTSDQLAEMRKFYDANGGFEKIKSKISNPVSQPEQSFQPAQPVQPVQQEQTFQYNQPVYTAPEGSITAQEFIAHQYFNSLAKNEAYSSISKEIADGSLLKEMADFNINAINQDGSINDSMVRRFLDLKAQTVVARQTSATPVESAAPTVDYVQVGENINSMQEAMAVLQQDSALKMQGRGGHPSAAKAEEFMRGMLNNGNK